LLKSQFRTFTKASSIPEKLAPCLMHLHFLGTQLTSTAHQTL
jgi:hypothetical protein